MKASIDIARVYGLPARSRGARFLVDRLWPRGIRKEDIPLEGWLKDAAPSTALRKWFGHDPARWSVFANATRLSSRLTLRAGSRCSRRHANSRSPWCTPPRTRSTTMRWCSRPFSDGAWRGARADLPAVDGRRANARLVQRQGRTLRIVRLRAYGVAVSV